jgi:prephenate dehydrogenase
MFGVFGYRKVTTREDEWEVAFRLAARITVYQETARHEADDQTCDELMLVCLKEMRARMTSQEQHDRIRAWASSLSHTDFNQLAD